MNAELLDDLRERLVQVALPTYAHPAGYGTIALNNAIRTFASDRRLGAIQEYSVEAFRRPGASIGSSNPGTAVSIGPLRLTAPTSVGRSKSFSERIYSA